MGGARFRAKHPVLTRYAVVQPGRLPRGPSRSRSAALCRGCSEATCRPKPRSAPS